MSSLISLRAELMRGDSRALYLGWLASLPSRDWDDEDDWDEEDADDDDRLEPPVPPGLAKLSAPLRALAEFLRVDDELIEVAAAGSAGEPPAEPSRPELARWVKGLPAADKDAYLLRFLAEEGDLLLRAELSKRFREATAPKGARPAPDAERRTVAQLLAARDALVEEKTRKAAERAGQGAGGPRARAGRGTRQVPRRPGPPRARDLARGRRADRHEAPQGLRSRRRPARGSARPGRAVGPHRGGRGEDPGNFAGATATSPASSSGSMTSGSGK